MVTTNNALFTCGRCAIRYHWHKSTSALRMTYCGFLCEIGDLGFSIAALERMERAVPAPTLARELIPA